MSLLDGRVKVEDSMTALCGPIPLRYFCSIEDVRALEYRLKVLLRLERVATICMSRRKLRYEEIYNERPEGRLVLDIAS